jgi:hypothetical protein
MILEETGYESTDWIQFPQDWLFEIFNGCIPLCIDKELN